MSLQLITSEIVDGENNAIILDSVCSVKSNTLLTTLDELKSNYGDRLHLLPLSACSAGGGVFQVKKPANGIVVGLQFTASPGPKTTMGHSIDITKVALDEIIIDQQEKQIYAGSAITLEQLNLALSEQLGVQFKVLGADLTSYTYAQVGATFMTGGMGPQRRYFSDSVREIALYDGDQIKSIKGTDLDAYAGTFGWSGLVSAVCCDYYQLPENEIAFAIPVNNRPADLARLLAHFSPFTYFSPEKGTPLTKDVILGLEHITVDSMQPFLRSGDNDLIDRAKVLSDNCRAANADGLIFVNGYSDLAVDEFLFSLVDDADAGDFTIAGINLDHTEIFNDPNQMRAIREGVPYAARTQSPKGEYIYKGHTDATVRINPNSVEETVAAIWRANEDYVNSVNGYFSSNEKVRGEILVYGHLNPFGIDPHNRITFASDEKDVYRQAKVQLHQYRDIFYQSLQKVCAASDSEFIGGEKSVASEMEIFPAFGGPEHAPPALKKKIEQQIPRIRAASRLFNWRALAPYV